MEFESFLKGPVYVGGINHLFPLFSLFIHLIIILLYFYTWSKKVDLLLKMLLI